MVSEELYNEIISYCKKRLYSKKADDIYDFIDLAHDVICNDAFPEDNFKVIADRLIFAQLAELRNKKIEIEKIHFKQNDSVEEIWICNKCHSEAPKSKFRLSWRLCDKCYREKNKERIKEINLRSYYKHHEKRLAEKRAYHKRYRQENLEEMRKRERERYHKKKTKHA